MNNRNTTQKVNQSYNLTTLQLRRLIEIRAKIQKFNLDLLEQLEEVEFDKIPPFHKDFYQSLLGSNFSLWRFAFLTYVDRESDSIF